LRTLEITIPLAFIVLSLTVCADVDDGLIAYYPFDGNANDSSGNGSHGSVQGALLTLDRYGQPNSAYFFDGVDDYITAAVTDLPTGSVVRTLSLWAKAIPDPTRGVALAHWGDEANLQSFGIIVNSSPYTWRGMAYGGGNSVDSGVVADTEWHHVVVTYDGEILGIYLDEVLKGTKPISISTEQSDLTIGSVSSGSTMLYNGVIDDVRIYDRVITSDEIHELYCCDAALALEVGLEANFPLNGSGADVSGNGHHATEVNVDFGFDRFGVENSAATFNGMSQYIQFGTRDFDFPDGFAFSGWVNFASGLGVQGPRIYSSPGWEITTTGTGPVRQIQFGNAVVGVGGAGIISAGDFNAGEWHHICATRVSGTIILYVNGNMEASMEHPGTVDYSSGWFPTLGTNSGALNLDRFGGQIDDVRLYNRGLSQREVEALFSIGLESPLDPILGGIPVGNLEDWYLSGWFGYYSTTFAPWIFHAEHGFLYRFPESTNASMFFYDDSMGAWWWTNEGEYPYIYVFAPPADYAGTDIESNWLFFFGDTASPRVFGVMTGDHAGEFLFFDP